MTAYTCASCNGPVTGNGFLCAACDARYEDKRLHATDPIPNPIVTVWLRGTEHLTRRKD